MPQINYEEFLYCSNCEKEIDGEWAGMPISGTYMVCEFCKRNEADLYPDNKGLEHRQRNPYNTYNNADLSDLKEQLRTEFENINNIQYPAWMAMKKINTIFENFMKVKK